MENSGEGAWRHIGDLSSVTAMVVTRSMEFNRTICCCRTSVFNAFIGVVLALFIIGITVSAINHTLAFAERDSEPQVIPYCKYYARYYSSEQVWNIGYFSPGLVDLYDETLNETVQQKQRGVFIEFAFKNCTKT